MSDIQADPQVIDPAPADPAPTEPEVKTAPDTSWVPKRISEITAARRAAEQRAADLEAEVARLRAAQTSAPVEGQQQQTAPPDIDKLARSYAERMVRDQTEVQTMNQRIESINAAGAKEFGDDYEKSVQNLGMAGIGGPDFLKVLTNIDGAEKVVTWLGKNENINEAMRIASMDPIQMGIELTKLSPKAAKALGKQISKAPPPVEPVGGGGGSSDGAAPDPKDTKAWMEWRNKNRKSRR
jgi:hypothetical protein